MKKFVITIGREFGCNASGVGRSLASRLGVKFYEKELVDEAAKIAGIDESAIINIDRKSSRSGGGSQFFEQYINEFGYGVSSQFFTESAVEAQGDVIRQIANRESCVMFGRCADYFLSEFGFTLNVFLYAPLEFRTAHVSTAYGLSAESAARLIAKIDRKRHRYYKFITGKNRGDRHGRNLMIDMQQFSVDNAVELIFHAAQLRFGE
ncbi:AAA family ATPase [Treponema sp.]|uniref:cytidylate kinase-like family protein n=1 Tax=Treponema sp. TaxID=166 RepID=UPI003EFCA557